MGAKNGPLFRKVCVFDVSRAVRVARFKSVTASRRTNSEPFLPRIGKLGGKGPDCVADPSGNVSLGRERGKDKSLTRTL